jgi:catechol 2,3-dioxygenase-like lactoylglutathione lyase family enzyme
VTIVLNHTIVRASNKEESASFFASIIGLTVGNPSGPFAPVRVNGDLTFDFDDRHDVVPGHYAFLVDDESFDRILANVDSSGAEYGAGPETGWNREINHLFGGRGIYVRDPDGHSYEFFTRIPDEIQ